ncbi:MAG TPA: hypothetical protein PK078_09935 [Anaerolineales bacterium]|nr:hypothetical protein [Anaerolineales bacterium]HNB35374.1 hypothetical protein [Anaerolineales bacterium]
MDREKAEEFVVRELGKHHNRNEIIVTLCEKMKINWKDAEKLVREIEMQNERKILVRQSPITLAVGVITFFIGLLLLFNGGVYFMNLAEQQQSEAYVSLVLSLRYAYIQIGEVVTGLGMVIGGSIGSLRAMVKLMK